LSISGNVVSIAQDNGTNSLRTRHAGTTLGAGVADDNDGLLLLLDLVAFQRSDKVIFLIEHASLTNEASTLLTSDLANTATGSERTTQNLNVTGALDGVGEGADDLLVTGEVGSLLQVLSHSLTGDGHARAVNETLLQQKLEQRRSSTNLKHISHDVLAGGLQIGEEGNAVGHGLEVVDGELNTNGVRNGNQVQHGIGGATGDVDEDHGVLEGLSSQNIAGTDVLGKQLLDRATSSQTLEVLGLGVGRVGRGTGKGHAHGLNGGGHGVGGVHTTAGTLTRAGVTDDVEALGFGDLFGDELSVGLEGGDNVDIGVVLSHGAAGLDGTAVDHDTGTVDTTHGHHDTGHVLVTAGNTDVGIVPLTTHHSLNGVGDQVTTLQGVAHALGTHTDGVADTDRVELETDQALVLYTLAHLVVEVEQMHIAGIAIEPDGRDSDLSLVHVLLLETDGVKHSLGGTLSLGLGDMAGDLVKGSILLGAGDSGRESPAVESTPELAEKRQSNGGQTHAVAADRDRLRRAIGTRALV